MIDPTVFSITYNPVHTAQAVTDIYAFPAARPQAAQAQRWGLNTFPGCGQENRGQRAERLATSPQLEGTVADLQAAELPRGSTSPLSCSRGSAWKEGHPAERPQARTYPGRALLGPLEPLESSLLCLSGD